MIFLTLALAGSPALARADAVGALRGFAREVKSARADFTQTVTAPDKVKKRSSQGTLEFLRPNRFRFVYGKPYEQLIVGDGQKVWLYDADLNQVTVRLMSQALGATPAALLAGGALDKDFDLTPLPDQEGLQWALATPKSRDGQFQSLRVGFRGNTLASLEVLDSFGQRSRLDFTHFEVNANLSPSSFEFKPPPGSDVIDN